MSRKIALPLLVAAALVSIPVTGMSSLCNLSFPLPAVMLFYKQDNRRKRI